MDNPQVVPYYIDDNRLIVLFMKIEADMFVMTMSDIQQFHLKRSLVKKNMEYVYMFPLSAEHYHGAAQRCARLFTTQYSAFGEFQF